MGPNLRSGLRLVLLAVVGIVALWPQLTAPQASMRQERRQGDAGLRLAPIVEPSISVLSPYSRKSCFFPLAQEVVDMTDVPSVA